MVAPAYELKNWSMGIVLSRAGESRADESRAGESRADESRAGEPWIELDRQLRSVASRRAALDHEELTLIRRAVRIQIWRRLGMVSMREYLEDRMGYGPQVAAERLRITDALEGLPLLEDALATCTLHYSAVRELTRIATCKTERAWVEACRGKNLRQIEELVAEREPGDGPKDRPKPELRPEPAKLMLRPVARALIRQVRHALANERGEPVDDSELIEELCRSWLAGTDDSADTRTPDMEPSDGATSDGATSDGEPSDGATSDGKTRHRNTSSRALRRRSRPAVQVSIMTCDVCKQARQHAAGRAIAITEAEYETAACDAMMIGSVDGAPCRARSTIPPKIKRQVKQRDNYKCTMPGCRSAANVDVHHIVHREHGGGHEPENLTCLCYGHHAAHHRGELLIEGNAPDLTFTRRYAVPHVGDRGDHSEDVLRDALLALTTLGFKKHEADRAVSAARELVRPEDGLEPLLRAALRELR